MEQRIEKLGSIQLAALVHDLRTPMCVAAGAAQMALDAGGKDVSAQLRQILLAVNAMDRMLSMHGEERHEAGIFTAAELQRELLAMTQERALRKKQRLSIDLSALEGVILQADNAALNRVLINLLGNAMKYTQEGGSVTLRAQTEHRSREKEQMSVRFIITDDGPGMSRAFMRQMYLPFARAKETAQEPGEGLGLSIVRDMVKRLGGTIRVHSARGRGTVFAVIVPVRIVGGGMVN
ncbi:MAG: hypothetical protein E7337_18315 [Clostridiales bacterium]|nr:hypothetical protein [Clostridiales bacterium]MBE5800351.1 hypothetical protein [Clostridiales bacterium]